ncbi:MAG: M20 family metallo-hydrolase [Desulfohalobiaceae bacterium]|nr:M20 family metallo-hydrolase [Desulfohalobiaceae bacterium]
MHPEQLFNFLDKQGESAVYLQRELVALPALGPDNGGQGEHYKAEFLSTYLTQLGLQNIQEFPAEDPRVESGRRPNIMAVLPGKDPDRTLWVISHLDVVPPGDLSHWDTDPFTLHQDGDLLYGRGTEDNHHGIVSSILAVKAFLKNNAMPQKNLGLLFVADEETGNDYGLDFLFRYHSDIFRSGDIFLVPDFGTQDSNLVDVSEKGLMWLKITVIGRQCHGSTPEKGRNSLLAASAAVLELRNLYQQFDREDPLFSPPYSTFEATKKEANVPNINTIPGRDVFYLDCRTLPEYDLDEVIRAVRAVTDRVAASYGVDIQLETVHRESAPATDQSHPFVQYLLQSIAAVYNADPAPRGIGGGTVAAFPRKEELPAAVWATLLGNAHQPNEHTSIRNMLGDAKVITHLALQLTEDR